MECIAQLLGRVRDLTNVKLFAHEVRCVMTTQKLPLFPLNTVLFPGVPLPLHIFEERYRLMIGRCIEQHAPFGVVLIRELDRADTNPDVTFYTVGTTAQI